MSFSCPPNCLRAPESLEQAKGVGTRKKYRPGNKVGEKPEN